jgi:hypothetical protein
LDGAHKIAVLCIFIRLVIRTARKLSVVGGIILVMVIMMALSLNGLTSWVSEINEV